MTMTTPLMTTTLAANASREVGSSTGSSPSGPLSTPGDFEAFCADYDAVDGNLGIQRAKPLDPRRVGLPVRRQRLCMAVREPVPRNARRTPEPNPPSVGPSVWRPTLRWPTSPIWRASTEVGGELRVEENHSLVSLTGLNNLVDVGEGVVLSNNSELADTTGLLGLLSIGGDLIVDNNDVLNNFSGPGSLQALGGVLEITNNPNLNAIAGFNELSDLATEIPLGSVGYEIRIANNPNLISFAGFPQIGTLPVGLYIEGGPALTYSAFAGVSVIQGKLELRGFGANSTITGLNNLASVVQDVIIEDFQATTVPLSSLATVGGTLRGCKQPADRRPQRVGGHAKRRRRLGGRQQRRPHQPPRTARDPDYRWQLPRSRATISLNNGQPEGLRDAIGEASIGGSISISNYGGAHDPPDSLAPRSRRAPRRLLR